MAKQTAQVSAPPLVAQEDNYNSAAESHQDRKEVGVKSETYSELVNTHIPTIMTHIAIIENQVQQRINSGKKLWFSPFDPSGPARKEFTTKKACQAHMTKTAKSRIEQAKIEGKDPVAYSPKFRMDHPPLRMEDVTTPAQAAMTKQAIEAHKAMAPMMGAALKGGSTELKAYQLLAGPESLSKPKVPKLSDHELKECARLAWARSKKGLTRACRNECARRNITLLF